MVKSMFQGNALGVDDGTKVGQMIKKGKQMIAHDTKQELYRLTESKAQFYEMLNSKVTDNYKVNEFDSSFREQVPHHFQ